MIRVEACVTSVDEALGAVDAGADRVELCSNLDVGGLTPARDLVHAVREQVAIPLFAMVRPRAGSHRITSQELSIMLRQIENVVDAGANGIVLGVLDKHDRVDRFALDDLVAAADPLPVTFHRAFDDIMDPLAAIDELATAGVSRVLTSGGAKTAWEGRDVLRKLVLAARGRVIIVAGGTVRGDHVRRLIEHVENTEVHARASAIPNLVSALRQLN